MVINIPINVDENLLNNSISSDLETKVNEHLYCLIDQTLIDRQKYRWGNLSDRDKIESTLKDMIEVSVSNYIKEYKDEIIEMTSDKLADRLARTKAAKEL